VTSSLRWVLAIVGLLAANAIAMAVLAVTATTREAQVIPAYYDQATHYDEVIDEAARSGELAWHASATIDHGAIVVELRDATGAAIAGARVRVAGYQRSRAVDRFTVELAALAAGRYRGVTDSGKGVHDLVITAERGAARFVERVVVEAR